MKKKPSALSIFLIIMGALYVLVNGYDIIGGGAPVKTWVALVFGLILLALGLIMAFGKTKPSTTTPKEDAMALMGVCVGWGACTLLTWVNMDCAFDQTTVVNLGALVILIVYAVIKSPRDVTRT
jgi:hypothetical protein